MRFMKLVSEHFHLSRQQAGFIVEVNDTARHGKCLWFFWFVVLSFISTFQYHTDKSGFSDSGLHVIVNFPVESGQLPFGVSIVLVVPFLFEQELDLVALIR